MINMENHVQVKRPQGRPKLEKPKDTRLPVIRVTPEKLDLYKQAADKSGKTFSAWARDTLERAAKRLVK